MVTVETALVLPVLLMFALVAVAAIGVAQARLHCADGAREAARAAARGQLVSSTGSAQIIAVRRGNDEVATATVRVRPLGWLPAVTVVESATAAVESSEPAP